MMVIKEKEYSMLNDFLENTKLFTTEEISKLMIDYTTQQRINKSLKVVTNRMKNNAISEHLSKLVGKSLSVEQKYEIIELIDARDKRGRLRKSITSISEYLYNNHINYKIEVWRIKDRSFWVVSECNRKFNCEEEE